MLNPELSKAARDAFKKSMEGKVSHSERACVDRFFSDDLYHAIDAAVEAALRFVQNTN